MGLIGMNQYEDCWLRVGSLVNRCGFSRLRLAGPSWMDFGFEASLTQMSLV